MATLTPFGVAVRKLRLEKGLRLVDMAKPLGMSTAFLSAIETGRKPIPDGLLSKISRSLEWTAGELALVRRAIEQSRKEVRLDGKSAEDRELIAAFARSIDKVPAATISQLKKLLLKSVQSEVPFQRSRRGIVVPPLGTAALRQFAESVRAAFVPEERVDFPIMDVIEFGIASVADPNFVFDVQEVEEMGENEGLVPIGGCTLILRRDVYEGACQGGRRHRFTASHELGHYLLHRHITFARARSDSDKIYTDSEWQADTFAGTLLMSPRHAASFSNSDEMAEACITSRSAASCMWEKYKEERII